MIFLTIYNYFVILPEQDICLYYDANFSQGKGREMFYNCKVEKFY